jgi:hypothetical protein
MNYRHHTEQLTWGRRRAQPDISIRFCSVRSAASSLPPSSRWKSEAARGQPPPAIYASPHSTQLQKLPHLGTASPRSRLQRAYTRFTSPRSALPGSICWRAFHPAKDERGQQQEELPWVEGDRGERGGRAITDLWLPHPLRPPSRSLQLQARIEEERVGVPIDLNFPFLNFMSYFAEKSSS